MWDAHGRAAGFSSSCSPVVIYRMVVWYWNRWIFQAWLLLLGIIIPIIASGKEAQLSCMEVPTSGWNRLHAETTLNLFVMFPWFWHHLLPNPILLTNIMTGQILKLVCQLVWVSVSENILICWKSSYFLIQLVTQSFRNRYKHRLKEFLILFSFISDQRARITEIFKHDIYLLL